MGLSSPAPVQKLCQLYELSTFLSPMVLRRCPEPQDVPAFLNGTLREHLPSPDTLPDIQNAAAMIAKAMLAGETIGLWGDYDVDGATSTALWIRFMRDCGIQTRPYIPDRFKEGYGPNAGGIQTLYDEGVRLLVTLDCGTTAFDALEKAHDLGMQVIVVDHHAAEDTLPKAAAVVNPKRQDAPPESKKMEILAAVGVSFFVLIALTKHLDQLGFFNDKKPKPDLRQYLDLVALGTVCDMVPLMGVNRLLLRQGLKVAAKGLNPGLRVLCHEAGVDGAWTPYHAGFVLGPRINAGGRLGESSQGARLLSAETAAEAEKIARQLNALNISRRNIEKTVTDAALEQAEEYKEDAFLVLGQKGWHEGVIGISAARVKDKTGKPVFVLSFDEDGKGKGSGRAPAGVDLGALIHQANKEGLILQGGGHKAAGGISLTQNQLPAFRAFCQTFLQAAPPTEPEPYVLDGTLTFQSLTRALYDEIQILGPFGCGNPEPLFLFENVHILHKRSFGAGHLFLSLGQTSGSNKTGLVFRANQSPLGAFLSQDYLPAVNLIAKVSLDPKNHTLQLIIEDILPNTPNAEKTATTELESKPDGQSLKAAAG